MSANIKRILIPSQMGIGNIILFSPFLKKLRYSYPNAHIALAFTHSNGSDKFISEVYPSLFDEIIILNTNKSNKFVRVFKGALLGLKKWDVYIYRFNSINAEFLVAGLFSYRAMRIGHASSADWSNRYNWLLTHQVKMTPNSHESMRYMQLLKPLGVCYSNEESRPSIDINVPEPDAVRLHKTQDPATDYLILVPGTSINQSWKRWPVKRWAELVHYLNVTGQQFYLVGSGSEKYLIESICNEACVPSDIHNLAGLFDFTHLINFVKNSSCLITCDSSVMHIADALNTNVIAIFGPTDRYRTGPIGAKSKVLKSNLCRGGCYTLLNPEGHKQCDTARCMSDVTVQMVLHALSEF